MRHRCSGCGHLSDRTCLDAKKNPKNLMTKPEQQIICWTASQIYQNVMCHIRSWPWNCSKKNFIHFYLLKGTSAVQIPKNSRDCHTTWLGNDWRVAFPWEKCWHNNLVELIVCKLHWRKGSLWRALGEDISCKAGLCEISTLLHVVFSGSLSHVFYSSSLFHLSLFKFPLFVYHSHSFPQHINCLLLAATI